jgi:hypothetical protein
MALEDDSRKHHIFDRKMSVKYLPREKKQTNKPACFEQFSIHKKERNKQTKKGEKAN